MTIELYNCSSNPIEVNKTLTAVATLTGTLKQGTSMVNPVIQIEMATVPSFNYMIIPEFSRRYFVNNIYSVYNNLWEIHGHCDVLSTYWSSIRTADCIINRNEFVRTKDLVDSEMWFTADSKFGLAKFSQQPLTGSPPTTRYVMVLAGAGTAPTKKGDYNEEKQEAQSTERRSAESAAEQDGTVSGENREAG